jgi:hypothetical protein
LYEQVQTNLPRYRKAKHFNEILGDHSLTRELDIEFYPEFFEKLRKPDEETSLFEVEVENCQLVFDALPGLTPSDARDARLWVFLCHTYGLAYSRARWPVAENDLRAVKDIRNHFFAKDGTRDIERNNALSRLWWMTHLCKRVTSLPLEKALEALLYKTDVRAQIIEHPTLMQNPRLFAVVIEKLRESFESDEALFDRKTSRSFISKLDTLGGFKLLDIFPENQLNNVINQVYEETLFEAENRTLS